jgi:hypothetical protein
MYSNAANVTVTDAPATSILNPLIETSDIARIPLPSTVQTLQPSSIATIQPTPTITTNPPRATPIQTTPTGMHSYVVILFNRLFIMYHI